MDATLAKFQHICCAGSACTRCRFDGCLQPRRHARQLQASRTAAWSRSVHESQPAMRQPLQLALTAYPDHCSATKMFAVSRDQHLTEQAGNYEASCLARKRERRSGARQPAAVMFTERPSWQLWLAGLAAAIMRICHSMPLQLEAYFKDVPGLGQQQQHLLGHRHQSRAHWFVAAQARSPCFDKSMGISHPNEGAPVCTFK